jgi:hypothetical protein
MLSLPPRPSPPQQASLKAQPSLRLPRPSRSSLRPPAPASPTEFDAPEGSGAEMPAIEPHGRHLACACVLPPEITPNRFLFNNTNGG